MNSAISRRRCAQWLGSAGLSILAGGCSSIFARKPAAISSTDGAAVQTTPDRICIIYRTRTDRLNLAGAKLPHCSIAELHVEFPHDEGKVAMCSAVVKATPCSASATPFPERGMSSTVASIFDGDSSAGSAPPTAAWSGDVALWEAQAIVASLEELNFFRKHRTILTAEVYLSVETGKHAVGKRYRPVAELDALILRIAQPTAGQDAAMAAASHTPLRVADLPPRGELARLPALD